MMYKFSKRRQKICLHNLNRGYQDFHDTGRISDYRRHCRAWIQFMKHPRIFGRLDGHEMVRLSKNGIRHHEFVYYLKK